MPLTTHLIGRLDNRLPGQSALAVLAALSLAAGTLGSGPARAAEADGTPVKGGTLVYLEQQAHTNLYPPAGGFYPNGGILNQITDKLTYQNPKTLEIEPWIAESWTVNADATEYTFKIRPGVTFSDGTPLDAAAVAKNFDTFGLGNKDAEAPGLRGHQQLRPQRGHRSADGEILLQEAVARLPAGDLGDRLRPRFARDARAARSRTSATPPRSSAPARSWSTSETLGRSST